MAKSKGNWNGKGRKKGIKKTKGKQRSTRQTGHAKGLTVAGDSGRYVQTTIDTAPRRTPTEKLH